MTKAFLDNELPLPDAIIPVPLHKRRERWRGFNQSELLADCISENLTPGMEIPVLNNVLIRTKHTTPQMKVKKYAERRKNIQGVFGINHKCHSELARLAESKRVEGSNVIPAPAFARINSSGIQSPKLDSGSPACRRGREAGMTKYNLLKNKKILLIDDIATTGATLNECARILKESGAKKVFAAVLARQEFRKTSPPLP
jgi:predicted amidophosphoribosyltransferase